MRPPGSLASCMPVDHQHARHRVVDTRSLRCEGGGHVARSRPPAYDLGCADHECLGGPRGRSDRASLPVRMVPAVATRIFSMLGLATPLGALECLEF